MKRTLLLLAAWLPLVAPAQSSFPLKISENRRHFVTQQEKKVRRIPSPPGEDLVLLIQTK